MTNTTPPVIQHFAFLIGAHAYPQWDRGAHDLQGPRNDVKAWFQILRNLGVPADHIQVQTSALLTAEELGATGVNVGPATKLSVYEGFARLIGWGSTAVGARPDGRTASPTAGENVVVFVVFSGHGDYGGGRGSYVALSDYAGGPLDARTPGLIDLAFFENAVEELIPGATCVFVVDACRSGAHRTERPAAVPAKRSVVLTASRPGFLSYERFFHAEWRSELSWAVQTVLEQWRVESRGAQPYVAISYDDLVTRAGQLLLPFEGRDGPQQPQLLADGAGPAPFLHPADSRLPTDAFAKPTPSREFGVGTTEFWTGDKTAPGNNSVLWAILNQFQDNQGNITRTFFVNNSYVANNTVQWPAGKLTIHRTEPQVPSNTLLGGAYTSFPVGAEWSSTTGATAKAFPFTPTHVSAGGWLAANLSGNAPKWACAVPNSAQNTQHMLLDVDDVGQANWQDHSYAVMDANTTPPSPTPATAWDRWRTCYDSLS